MISICLATYNGSAYIEAQLRSVLEQLSQKDEVVVADDGSTDDTIAIVDAIGDPRIRWVAQGGRLGVVKNFERSVSAASGEYIFLCDQDDVWLPGKVEHCIAALQTHLLVVTDCKIVDSELNEIAPSFFRLRNSGSGLLHNLWKNGYLGCCMAFRRELLNYALPFPQGIPMHDMWLGLIAETQGSVSFLPKPLSLYRRHICSASDAAGRSSASIGKMLADRGVLASLVAGRTIINMFAKAR
ncbi:MAG: glycosyltransferase family 2 protein [Thiobacillus sp.]